MTVGREGISTDAITFTSAVSSTFVLGIDYAVNETAASWAVDLAYFTFTTLTPENDVTFWTAKQDGAAIPIFTYPGTTPPP